MTGPPVHPLVATNQDSRNAIHLLTRLVTTQQEDEEIKRERNKRLRPADFQEGYRVALGHDIREDHLDFHHHSYTTTGLITTLRPNWEKVLGYQVINNRGGQPHRIVRCIYLGHIYPLNYHILPILKLYFENKSHVCCLDFMCYY